MKFEPDDPRLTAYVLGELTPTERTALETDLRNSPELREALAEIQQATAALGEELRAESSPKLLPAQLDAIRQHIAPDNIVHLPRRAWWLSAPAIAAMAAIFLMALAWQFERPRVKEKASEQMARMETPVADLPNLAPAEAAPSVPVQTASESIAPISPVAPAPAPVLLPPLPPASVESKGGIYATQPDVVSLQSLSPKETSKTWQSDGSINGGKVTSTLNLADTKNVGAIIKGSANANTTDASGKLIANAPSAAPAGAFYATTKAQRRSEVSRDNTKGVPQLVELPRPEPNLSRNRIQGFSDSYPGGQVAEDSTILAEGLGPNLKGERFTGDEQKSSRRRSKAAKSDTATYPKLVENTFLSVMEQPLSTFSTDVDAASYANIRRFLTAGQMPPQDAVRIEEMVNYFTYKYPQPHGDDPFSVNLEVAGCPWNTEHRLVRIGLKGREIANDQRAAGNFVFLIDVSGSMQPAERLPLIKQGLRQLVKKLGVNDRVAIVVYASEVGVRLASTSCERKEEILAAIDALGAGGSTNGGDGIREAYRQARENFIEGGVNRVVLCTDGDFNVGTTSENDLVQLIQKEAKSGVFLTTLGVGTDNYKDALMQKLADKGNGNYYYLDTLEEAQKVLGEQMNATLVTIAKDVKIQVEFNPAQVSEYRLIGYEKRMLRKEDFNDDARDAGEIGAGHTVTALYEIVPAGGESHGAVDDLKYQPPAAKPERYIGRNNSKEMLTLKLRYKQPEGDRSRLLEFSLTDKGGNFNRASADFRFAAAVSGFGMLLRDSEYKGDLTYGSVWKMAEEAKGADESGLRSECINLIKQAARLQK